MYFCNVEKNRSPEQYNSQNYINAFKTRWYKWFSVVETFSIIKCCWPTLEALVDSRREGVSQHHHRGVDDDFSASTLGSCHLPLASAAIQFQRHFVVVAIQEDLVPLAVVEAIFGQGEVVVSVADVVGDAEKTLQNLSKFDSEKEFD